ncbi:c6 zinc finger domain containing protein [Niveomyces insectorum RCEF 264]|uniref:C6 zinc finger domain containing protein n=1 Tax=Niveomyces insectorum RCEF 264 TaxID=1081102 RepID=A0A167RVR1_9HYPO|nr:c6 zinc finger domain containing protein [Niveomyces insectorum RCEF 264]
MASSTAGTPNGPPNNPPNGPANTGHASSHTSKSTRILACVLCQHRKIKCDRTFPCANCIKANVTCTPSTPAPARKRRRPNQDLQERLARCEELLKVYASAKPEGEGGGAGAPPDPAQQLFESDTSSLKWKPPGKLIVEDDGGVRFVDSILLGTIHDELRAMREIVDGEDNDDITPETTATPDDNADLVLAGSCEPMSGDTPRSMTPEDLQPAPEHVFRLWQIYLERVNPLTKIIHVPTLQPYFVEATSGGQNLPQNIKTLLFAIYTLAAVAMTPDECLALLGYSRENALQRFSNGVRLSLIRTGFMKTYDLETLQALVIYLISLQGRYNRHAAWILNGVVLRTAQKMGLHRDGEALGLSPFETEIRRRVWWQIIMVDIKYALISGLSHSMLPRAWDTKEPKNVNDADLFPTATEPIQDREGPTEMIMVLITNRLARFLLETPGAEPIILLSDADTFKGHGGPSQQQVDMYRQLISNLAQSLLETIDKYSDPTAGPLHEMALDVKADILEKIEHVLLPHKEQEFSDEVRTLADNVFRIAVGAIAHENEHYTKTKARGFSWFSRMFFQDSMFLFVVGQLCTRTTGKLVEKAWDTVQATYSNYTDLFDVTQRMYYQIGLFVLRAWRTRESILRARLGDGVTFEPPDFITKLRAVMPSQEDASTIKTEPSSASSAPASGTATHTAYMTTTSTAAAAAAAATSSAPFSMPSSSSSSAATLLPPADELFAMGMDDKMQLSSPDLGMEGFFTQPYMDPNTIDWEMWGNIMPMGPTASTFDNLGSNPNPW